MAGASSDIWLRSTKNLSLLQNLNRNYNYNHHSAIVFAPNGKIIASGGAIGDDEKRSEIRFWNVTTGSLLNSFVDYERDIYSLSFSPDGGTLASGGTGGSVKLWSVETGKLTMSLKTINTPHDNYALLTTAFSPNGKMLAVGDTDGTIRIWKLPQ